MYFYSKFGCMIWKQETGSKHYQVCCEKCHYHKHQRLVMRKLGGTNIFVCCGVGKICLKARNVISCVKL